MNSNNEEANNAKVPNNLLTIMGMTREQYKATRKAKRAERKVKGLLAESAKLANKSNAAVRMLHGARKHAPGGGTKVANNDALLAELEAMMAAEGVAAPAPAAAAPAPAFGALRYFYPQVAAAAAPAAAAAVGAEGKTTNAILAELEAEIAAERPKSPTQAELARMPKAERNAYYERKLAELGNGSSGGRRRSTRRRRSTCRRRN
jgi:hypothetical protein